MAASCFIGPFHAEQQEKRYVGPGTGHKLQAGISLSSKAMNPGIVRDVPI